MKRPAEGLGQRPVAYTTASDDPYSSRQAASHVASVLSNVTNVVSKVRLAGFSARSSRAVHVDLGRRAEHLAHQLRGRGVVLTGSHERVPAPSPRLACCVV